MTRKKVVVCIHLKKMKKKFNHIIKVLRFWTFGKARSNMEHNWVLHLEKKTLILKSYWKQ